MTLHQDYGCVRFPLLENKLVVGDGEKAFENGKLIHSSNEMFLKKKHALILTSDENRLKRSKYQTDKWNKLNELVAYHRTWGDCYGYYLVCSGKAQVMIDVDMKTL